ncbi:MAG TPA: YgcG family protein, partial [Cyclobacteriaceae bacterium]
MIYRFITFLLLLFSTTSFAQKAVPELWGHRIHDEAHVLSQDTIDALEKELQLYEDSTSNQIAVLLVSSLDGESIEEYSLRVADSWKLGQKNKDNGVLLLVAIDDHKMRIEVGQGLEGVLTDAMSNRIIRNEMAPAFRRNDYNAGIADGINGIIKTIGGEYEASDSDGAISDDVIIRIIVGLFTFIILGVFTTIFFFVEGKDGWWMYAGLIPFYAAFPWISIGLTGGIILLITYIIGFPLLKKMVARSDAWKNKTAKGNSSSGKGSSKSSSSSRSSGSSWGSGSSSRSSFSGGGGSFGGGGSSGSW